MDFDELVQHCINYREYKELQLFRMSKFIIK